MNISGISSAASVSDYDESTNVGMTASIKVLDMAQGVFEDVAERLIAEMAALMTGLGQNIDTYA